MDVETISKDIENLVSGNNIKGSVIFDMTKLILTCFIGSFIAIIILVIFGISLISIIGLLLIFIVSLLIISGVLLILFIPSSIIYFIYRVFTKNN